MREACRKNLFEGVHVGRSNMQISIIQFVDDALLFREPPLKNIKVLKSVLRCFELASSLKVKFSKVGLVGLRWIREPCLILLWC